MRPRLPPPLGEPRGKLFRQCSRHAGTIAAAFTRGKCEASWDKTPAGQIVVFQPYSSKKYKENKAFFSEEKKQKTFANLAGFLLVQP
jgi:hypothetical protein